MSQRPDIDVVIVGVGMITSVGLSTDEAASSVRSGVSRFTTIPWRDQAFERFVVAAIPDVGLDPLESGLDAEVGLLDREKRMLRIGAAALRECAAVLGDEAASTRLYLALPETETTKPMDRSAFLGRLARQAGGWFDPAMSTASWRGRAGGITTLGEAYGAIRRGETDRMLIGGIDSYLALHLLGQLDFEGRLKSERNLDAFIPGEGAGFILLMDSRKAEALRLPALARVASTQDGFENGHLGSDSPFLGEGLAGVLTALFDSWGHAEGIREVYSSMNGESHWIKEWGVGFIRNRRRFDETYRFHHPADCFGETGAACGPLLVGLAAVGMHQGYRRGPALALCSSDAGARSAVALLPA